MSKLNLRTLLVAAPLAASAAFAAPALASMGTSQPDPPPPPPPFDVTARLLELSSASDIGERGHAGQVINHTRSAINGQASTTTGSGGAFRYTLQTGQSVSHRGSLFGLIGSSNADIRIATDGFVTLKVKAGEDEFDRLGDPTKVTWKAEYEIDRGGAVQKITADPFTLNFGSRTFSNIVASRHRDAQPGQVRRPDADRAASDLNYNPANAVKRTGFKLLALYAVNKSDPTQTMVRWGGASAGTMRYVEPGRTVTITLESFLGQGAK